MKQKVKKVAELPSVGTYRWMLLALRILVFYFGLKLLHIKFGIPEVSFLESLFFLMLIRMSFGYESRLNIKDFIVDNFEVEKKENKNG